MGSGCTNNCPSYFADPTPDKNIKYTGPAILSLGICTGDMLNEVDATILQKLIDYSTGVGINIPDIDLTSCDLFVNYITCCSTCTDLNCLMKVIFGSLCSLYNNSVTLKTVVDNGLSGPYNVGCLNVSSNSALNVIVQELITEFCALKTQVTGLQTTINGINTGINISIGNFLNNALSTCQGSSGITKSGTGSSFTASFKGFIPIGGIIPYGGATAGLFDTTGLGIVNTGMCGWAIANGNNGTVNMVEQTPVGAGIGIMGGTLPSNASGANYTLFSKVGESRHTLLASEIPSLPVTINDPGHFHRSTNFTTAGSVGGPFAAATGSNVPDNFSTTTNTTGITATSGGTGGSHNNVQPSTALMFIQRIS